RPGRVPERLLRLLEVRAGDAEGADDRLQLVDSEPVEPAERGAAELAQRGGGLEVDVEQVRALGADRQRPELLPRVVEPVGEHLDVRSTVSHAGASCRAAGCTSGR